MGPRREKIEAMLAEDPQDTFLRYSLAMELQKEGEWDASLAQFEELMTRTPPHVPSFFMAGKLLTQRQRIERARAVLRAGIDAARGQGDHHAASEMSEFLMALGGSSDGISAPDRERGSRS